MEVFATVLFLAFLEGLLSLDNALVLGVMVKHLPPRRRKMALTLGIWGAFGFRFLSLFFLNFLTEMAWLRVVGGGYLLWLAGKHFYSQAKNDTPNLELSPGLSFWRTVLAIELVDITFSIDSILAGASMSRNYWIVFAGAVLGILMMRFAANLFVTLFDRFPRMEHTAYLLVGIIGLKLGIEGFEFSGVDFNSPAHVEFWAFWTLLACGVGIGLIRPAHEGRVS